MVWLARRVAVVAALGMVAGTGAHIVDQLGSVHFNSGGMDFGTVPRRAVLRWFGEHSDRPARHGLGVAEGVGCWGELDEESGEHIIASLQKQRASLLANAERYEANGQWHDALQTYEQVRRYFGRRGTRMDRIQLFQRLLSGPRHVSPKLVHAVQLYLRGMRREERADPVAAARDLRMVLAESPPQFLADHADYQLAAILAEASSPPRAIAGYRRLLNKNPRSVKREETLVMLARVCLLALNRPQTGRAALKLLSREFPHTRFRSVAEGLRARAAFLERRYSDAAAIYIARGETESLEIVWIADGRHNAQWAARLVALYLVQLPTARTYQTYRSVAQGVMRIRQEMGTAGARALNRIVLADSRVAASYFYYRMYHDEKDVKGLEGIADAFARRHPAASLPEATRVWLAETYYQRHRYAKALVWSRGGSDRARFIRAATLVKLHQYRSSVPILRSLASRPGEIRHPAREELALGLEELGDLGGALEQYLALHYQSDIAFMLDARMTPRQIQAFAARRPARRYRDLLNYTLGIRFMRDERYALAERYLRMVPSRVRAKFDHRRLTNEWGRSSPSSLVAAQQLGSLYRAVGAARSANARANALFSYGSYFYSHGTLLMYNGALWQGDRAYGIDFWWNTWQNSHAETLILRRHMYSHDVYWRAREACLKAVRVAPHSRIAPRALYRAACATRWQANFNGWWRAEARRVKMWNQAAHLMRQLVKRYPHDALAGHANKYAAVWMAEWAEVNKWADDPSWPPRD